MKLWKKLITGLVMAVMVATMCLGTAMAEDESEKIHGLRLLTEHYGYHHYPLEKCRGLQYLEVAVIEMESMTGKRNLPGEPTAADAKAQLHH